MIIFFTLLGGAMLALGAQWLARLAWRIYRSDKAYRAATAAARREQLIWRQP